MGLFLLDGALVIAAIAPAFAPSDLPSDRAIESSGADAAYAADGSMGDLTATMGGLGAISVECIAG